jgi:hypothetical protein
MGEDQGSGAYQEQTAGEHWVASCARSSSDWAISPSALAVLMVMKNSPDPQAMMDCRLRALRTW